MKNKLLALSAALAAVIGLTVAGTAQSIQAIYSLTNGGPVNPFAGLTLGPDGNFYGTTYNYGYSGSSDYGTVFEVTTNGVLTTLVNFDGANGNHPAADLVLGPDGNFYGTTTSGGSSGDGTVFRMTTNGTLTTLYSFSALISNGNRVYTNSDGAGPRVPLTLGPDGNFYGTTYDGGSSGVGTAFRMTTNGTLTTLVNFGGYFYNGAYPEALTLGADGDFYGTTYDYANGGYGTVFRMTTNGALTTLVKFAYTNGAYPDAGLTLGPDGNFYGTTEEGGGAYHGTVFRVTTNGTLTMLVKLSDGIGSYSRLTLGPDGNFYGTSDTGGNTGAGTVFQVTTNGVLTTLADFDYTNGASPESGLILGPDGNFYGTTYYGGASYSGSFAGVGVIYRFNVSPTISRIIPGADGSLTLNLVSITNVSSRLYAATNLSLPILWRPIATNFTGGIWQFADTNTAGFPTKFYRASTP